jgi:hypothetical protein
MEHGFLHDGFRRRAEPYFYGPVFEGKFKLEFGFGLRPRCDEHYDRGGHDDCGYFGGHHSDMRGGRRFDDNGGHRRHDGYGLEPHKCFIIERNRGRFW